MWDNLNVYFLVIFPTKGWVWGQFRKLLRVTLIKPVLKLTNFKCMSIMFILKTTRVFYGCLLFFVDTLKKCLHFRTFNTFVKFAAEF